MGITTYESEEDMDDAFGDMMERETEKARLKEMIYSLESNVEYQKEQLNEAERELQETLDELERLD